MLSLFGRTNVQRKLPANFSLHGDISMRYNNKDYSTREMTYLIKYIRNLLLDYANTNNLDFGKMNYCLANLYRDETDHMDWHQDNKIKGGLDNDPIVSVSFGNTREFWIRDVITKEEESFLLEAGDLFIMLPGFNHKYEHALTCSPTEIQGRINLTFRSELL